MAPASVYDQILDYTNRANPYPLYTELRRTPVTRADDGSYVVSTYREIVALLHDPPVSSDLRHRAHSPTARARDGPPGLPPDFIPLDPTEHGQVRPPLTLHSPAP